MILSEKQWQTLTYTWGLPMALVGTAVGAVLTALGHKPEKNMYGKVFRIGKGWGGVNLGPVSIVSKDSTRYTLNHEFGHSIQNCYLGLLFPFLVAIPSACRYWHQRYKLEVEKVPYETLSPYDSIWFEGTATSLGNKYWEELNKGE